MSNKHVRILASQVKKYKSDLADPMIDRHTTSKAGNFKGRTSLKADEPVDSLTHAQPEMVIF